MVGQVRSRAFSRSAANNASSAAIRSSDREQNRRALARPVAESSSRFYRPVALKDKALLLIAILIASIAGGMAIRHFQVGVGGKDGKRPKVVDTRITFNRHIAPIIFAQCVECHNPIQTATFSLIRYTEVRERVDSILKSIEQGSMPPWLPDRNGPPLLGARGLQPGQVALIREWFEEGALEGKPEDLPKPPGFSASLTSGQPNWVPTNSLTRILVFGAKTRNGETPPTAGVDVIELPVPVSVLAVFVNGPASLRRLDLKAVPPDGTTIDLITIQDWNPRWQETYRYAAPISLPKDSILSFVHSATTPNLAGASGESNRQTLPAQTNPAPI